MKSSIITCDCGCGVKAQPYELGRWLTLSQHPERTRTAEPKIGRDGSEEDRELHFKDFVCLHRWTSGAMKIIPKMVKDASGLHPRGGFYTSEFPTLWF